MYVFDAVAIISLLERGVGSDKVKAIISESKRESPCIFMSAVNFGEAYYSLRQRYGRDVADQQLRELAGMPIVVVPADQEQALLAAQFKAKYHLPYADSFAAALAKTHDAKLVTHDADFQAVAREIDILWLGKLRKH